MVLSATPVLARDMEGLLDEAHANSYLSSKLVLGLVFLYEGRLEFLQTFDESSAYLSTIQS